MPSGGPEEVKECSGAPLKLYEECKKPKETEEFEYLAQRIHKVQERLAKSSESKPVRGTHVKAQGCFFGKLTVNPARAERTKFGVFANDATYSVWVRFANAWPYRRNDYLPDIRGMAVKVMDVPGIELNELGEKPEHVQDFLANDFSNASTPDAKTLVELTEASLEGNASTYIYLTRHPQIKKIFSDEIQRRIEDPSSKLFYIPLYATRYFSGSPFRWGSQAAKFIWIPCDTSLVHQTIKKGDYNFLGRDLKNFAQTNTICFKLYAQFQTNPDLHPIENSGVTWKIETAPIYEVATLRIPSQDSDKQNQVCEDLSFNPWRGLVDHRPLGNTNRGRKEIYKASYNFRKKK